MKTKYAHINIIAKDWKLLCEFYQEIFECVPISTERDHHGESIFRIFLLLFCIFVSLLFRGFLVVYMCQESSRSLLTRFL